MVELQVHISAVYSVQLGFILQIEDSVIYEGLADIFKSLIDLIRIFLSKTYNKDISFILDKYAHNS